MNLDQLSLALEHPNVSAFLAMIRHGEGTKDEDGYRRMFGGALFTDFSDHPRKPQTAKFKSGKRITSTAAGAYQFLAKTWDALVAQHGFADFSPRNQDLGAVALMAGRGALNEVMAGRFELGLAKCCKEWASLPGAPYGQPTITLVKARDIYAQAGGTLVASDSPGPSSAPLPLEEKTMAPFLLAALPALLDAVPKLMSIFGGNSEVAQRNEKAVALAVDLAKSAAGAANEQALVEALNDPAIAASVRQAIEDNWYQISLNIEGVAEARKQNNESAHFWTQPAIWVTVLLMPLVYFVTYSVMTGSFSSEVQSMVIASIVSGVLSAVTGFWLGTSFSSSRKSELMGK